MRIDINSKHGFLAEKDGDGIMIDGKEYHEAPFDHRWDDLIAVIDEGTGPAQLTYEAYRNTGFFMRFFRHNQDDNVFMTYQLPHQWDISTAVSLHAHIVPMASGSGTAKFDFAYSWIKVDAEMPAANGWTSGSISFIVTPDMQYRQKILSIATVAPTDQDESSILVLKVERPGASNATDMYITNKDHGTTSANIGVLSFDLHYQKSKAGTILQLPDYVL